MKNCVLPIDINFTFILLRLVQKAFLGSNFIGAIKGTCISQSKDYFHGGCNQRSSRSILSLMNQKIIGLKRKELWLLKNIVL